MPNTFGLQTGVDAPLQRSGVYRAGLEFGLAPQSGKKRKFGEAYDAILPSPAYQKNEIVGGRSFRAKNQHEGLPTGISEAYANGVKDKFKGNPHGASLKSSGPGWDQFTRKAYDAGFKLGLEYSPLTNADAVRAITSRTVLVSPPGKNASGEPLKIAGFHPSDISESVSESSHAHMKIFEAQAMVLQSRANKHLSSNEAADLAVAAIHLASLAPGEYANEASFRPTPSSKFNQKGRLLPNKPDTYEQRREELKIAVASAALEISQSDRKEINRLVDAFLVNVRHPALPPTVAPRRLGSVFAKDPLPPITSPRRTRPNVSSNPPELQFGKYDTKKTLPAKPLGVAAPMARAAFPFFHE